MKLLLIAISLSVALISQARNNPAATGADPSGYNPEKKATASPSAKDIVSADQTNNVLAASVSSRCGSQWGAAQVPEAMNPFKAENGFVQISSIESLRQEKKLSSEKIGQLKKECRLFGKVKDFYLCNNGITSSYYDNQMNKISQPQCDQVIMSFSNDLIGCLKNITYPNGRRGMETIGSHKFQNGELKQLCPPSDSTVEAANNKTKSQPPLHRAQPPAPAAGAPARGNK